MKIAVACSGLGHVARGNEVWAAEYAHALAARGETVRLFKGGGTAAHAYETVVPCRRRGDTSTQRLVRLMPPGAWRLGISSPYGLEQMTFALRLLAHLRRFDADVLHVPDPLVAVIAQRAAKLGLIRARTVLAHGTEEPFDFLRKITYLQHLGPWHLEEAKAAGVYKDTWTSIPNFIDADRFHPATAGQGEAERDGEGDGAALRRELNIPAEALVVLTVAAIKRHHKRVDYLICEFAKVLAAPQRRPVYLVVAGGWERDTDELVQQAERHLGVRVRMLVRFPHARMPELYRSADAFVLCSLKEMMPIALLEAKASGLPCLVNRHPVLEWMIGPGGEAIDMDRSGALAGALTSLLADDARRRQLGAAAREHCVQNFSRPRVVDQILQYYRTVVTVAPVQPAPATAPAPLPAPAAASPAAPESPLCVSVVIPAYRAAGTIRRAVDSLIHQTRPPEEIVVVDDGSPDDVAPALASYGPRVRLVRKPNGGAASARNMGIDVSTGDLIAFLDADDYWEPTKLERQCDVFRRHPEVALVASRFFNQLPGENQTAEPGAADQYVDRVVRVTGEEGFDLSTKVWTSTVVVRRSALGSHRFQSGLEPAEDRDLWLRVVTAAPVYYLSAPLATAVLEPNSLSRSSVDKDSTNMLRVVHRHRELLGSRGVRRWESRVYRKWAGVHLSNGVATAALKPAAKRLIRQPISAEAWWVLAKGLRLSAVAGLKGLWRRRRWGQTGPVAA